MNNNTITVHGILGNDGEYIRTKNGKELYENSLAVGFKDRNGEWGTDWFSIKSTDEELIDVLEDFKKGDLVEIVGNFTIDSFKRKGDLNETHKIVVWVEEITKLEKPSKQEAPERSKRSRRK